MHPVLELSLWILSEIIFLLPGRLLNILMGKKRSFNDVKSSDYLISFFIWIGLFGAYMLASQTLFR